MYAWINLELSKNEKDENIRKQKKINNVPMMELDYSEKIYR